MPMEVQRMYVTPQALMEYLLILRNTIDGNNEALVQRTNTSDVLDTFPPPRDAGQPGSHCSAHNDAKWLRIWHFPINESSDATF
jgi:hypothetical protein